MFVISKILAVVLQPWVWVFVPLLLALWWQRRQPQCARRCLWGALLVMLLIGWPPLPTAVIRHLESRYAEWPLQADVRGYTGMVVLGGATESGAVQQAHVQPLLGEAAERMTVPVALRARYPHLQLVFTGGEGQLFGSGPSEADRAKVFFDSMALRGAAPVYESASRNTYENAVFTAQLPGIDKTQPWLLVTSAAHMPRAMGTFKKAGWNVTAYPVDFTTADTLPWFGYSWTSGADRWEQAAHELVGLLAYRVLGRK